MGTTRRIPYAGARAYEDFRQKSVERFESPESRAKNHIIGRNEGVARLLAYVSLLRASGAIGRAALVVPSGAAYQSTKGSAALGQQAAHALPCQIKIGARDLTLLAPNDRTTDAIRTLFGHVSVLPRPFNAADTVAERVPNGLVSALDQACVGLIRTLPDGAGPRPMVFRGVGQNYGEIRTIAAFAIDRASVRDTYARTWLPAAENAYREAQRTVADSGAFLTQGDDRDEVLEVLRLYLRFHRHESAALLDAQLDEIERVFNGVEA